MADSSNAKNTKNEASKKEEEGSELKIIWDDSAMQTTYANSVNATSTREEVSIFFGTNQTWSANVENAVKVQLTDRIVLNPYAAKRLSNLLTEIISEYEKRFNELKL